MESIFSAYIYRRYRKWASDNRIRGFRPMHPVQRLHHHRPSNHVGSLFRWYPDKIWQEAPFLLSKASSTPYQPRSLITNRWQIDFIQVRNLRFRRNHEWSTLGIKINKTTAFPNKPDTGSTKGRLLCYIALLLAEYAGSSRGTCENEGSRRRSQYSGSNDTASIWGWYPQFIRAIPSY